MLFQNNDRPIHCVLDLHHRQLRMAHGIMIIRVVSMQCACLQCCLGPVLGQSLGAALYPDASMSAALTFTKSADKCIIATIALLDSIAANGLKRLQAKSKTSNATQMLHQEFDLNAFS